MPELERIGNSSPPAASLFRQGPPTSTPFNVYNQLIDLSKARDSFVSDPSMATVANVETSCKTLLALARQLNAARDMPTDFDCSVRSDEAKLQLEELEKLKRKETTYNQECGLSQVLGAKIDAISSDVRSKKIEPPEGLAWARKLLGKCSDLAFDVLGKSGGLEAAYAAMENFVSERSLDRNRFNIATTYLWKFDGDVRLAFSVALAQDLLILIYKFLSDYVKYSGEPRRVRSVGVPIDLSDDDGDPPEIRARKALLRLARPFRGASSQISEDDIGREQLPEGVEANLHALLNSLWRKDLVWQARKGVFRVDNDVLHTMETSLEQTVARSVKKTGNVSSSG